MCDVTYLNNVYNFYSMVPPNYQQAITHLTNIYPTFINLHKGRVFYVPQRTCLHITPYNPGFSFRFGECNPNLFGIKRYSLQNIESIISNMTIIEEGDVLENSYPPEYYAEYETNPHVRDLPSFIWWFENVEV